MADPGRDLEQSEDEDADSGAGTRSARDRKRHAVRLAAILVGSAAVGLAAYWTTSLVSPVQELADQLVIPRTDIPDDALTAAANLVTRYSATVAWIAAGAAFASTLLALGAVLAPDDWGPRETVWGGLLRSASTSRRWLLSA